MRPTPPLVEKEGGTEPGPFLLGFADLLRAWDRTGIEFGGVCTRADIVERW